MKTPEIRPTLVGILLQHVIVFLICVVFPGLVTWMIPATWITLERNEDEVRCISRTCVFFVVPYKVQRIDQVTGVSQRERSGKTEKQRKLGRTTDKKIEVQGEGFVQIQGMDNQLMEVSVSPASLGNVVERIKDFLSSKQESTTIFAIANWKFGILMGGTLTSFTMLYVVGYSLGFIKWILLHLKRTVVAASQPSSEV